MATDTVARQGTAAPEPSFALGTPTGIGSLPHADLGAAIAFVLDELPELPALPTLPMLDPRQGMVPQAAWGIAGVEVGTDGGLTIDHARLDPEAPLGDRQLDGAPFAALRPFLAALHGRTGAVKLQLTGPVTLGKALCAEGVAPDLAFRIAFTAVRERAEHLVAAVRYALPVAPLVVFVDEPSLAGSVSDLPLPVDQIIDLVSGALAVLEPHVVTGLHCCGAADWRALLQAGPQVLSVPLADTLAASAGALGGFVERGGWVAWGAVPTDGPLGESAARLWRNLSAQWCELVQSGCDPVRLRHQALVTPECGLALHKVAQSEQVFTLARQVGERLRDQIANVRLSVGA